APICGVDATTLRYVARTYARAEAAIIFWGMGISQHVHGTDNARCLIALALICGQVGRPGTGLHPLRGQNNVQGASDAGLIPMFFPDYRSVEDAGFRGNVEQAWGTKLDPKRGLTVVEIMKAVHAGTIKGMYVQGENPAMSDPDLNHAREALATLEHLVGQDRAGKRDHLSLRRAGQARTRRGVRRRLSHPGRARQARAGAHHSAGRAPRRGISVRALDRPPARALAYRRHDPARLHPRC